MTRAQHTEFLMGDPREHFRRGRRVAGVVFTPAGTLWLQERGAPPDMNVEKATLMKIVEGPVLPCAERPRGRPSRVTPASYEEVRAKLAAGELPHFVRVVPDGVRAVRLRYSAPTIERSGPNWATLGFEGGPWHHAVGRTDRNRLCKLVTQLLSSGVELPYDHVRVQFGIEDGDTGVADDDTER